MNEVDEWIIKENEKRSYILLPCILDSSDFKQYSTEWYYGGGGVVW